MMMRLLALSVALSATCAPACAQEANPLIGTWTVVYVNDERAEGVDLPLYGPKPSGMLMFDAQGRYSLQICAAGRPRFTSNDRRNASPDEYKAAVSGCNTHWGRYSVNETNGTIIFRIEHALYTNWEGTIQERPFRMANGLLRYRVPQPSTEAVNAVVVWRRAP